MSWARVDDRANEHRKQLAAGAEACWFWTCGLMYANRQDARDGFIPEAAIGMLYPVKNPKRLAEKLVEVGLWSRVKGGYQIHAYHQWNPTKEQLEEELRKGRERAARSRAERKAKREGGSGEPHANGSGERAPNVRPAFGRTKSEVTSESHSSGSVGVPEWSGSSSSSGSSDPEQPVRFSMSASWKPADETVAALEISGVPTWATEILIANMVLHFSADTSKKRTETEWNQAAAKWVLKDWRDPAKKPTKPEPDQAGSGYPPIYRIGGS